MTKKILFGFWLLLIVCMSTMLLNSCDKDEEKPKQANTNPDTPDNSALDSGVVINGVVWATRNVDAPGTFASTPESSGMFYQWNRNLGWSATDPLIASNGSTTWDASTPTGNTWESTNDPSPAGWRVPTQAELNSLLDSEKITRQWTTQNGATGYKFTDKTTQNSLFLPAAGSRNVYGSFGGAGTHGNYWHNTQDAAFKIRFTFDGRGARINTYSDSRCFGFSVRCVQE